MFAFFDPYDEGGWWGVVERGIMIGGISLHQEWIWTLGECYFTFISEFLIVIIYTFAFEGGNKGKIGVVMGTFLKFVLMTYFCFLLNIYLIVVASSSS